MKENATASAVDKRVAYFVMQTEVDEQGKYIALIAVENERGYHRTDWTWGKDFAHAEKTAEHKNDLLGITKKDAMKVQLSTMR